MQFSKDIVLRLGGSGYLTEIETLSHSLVADEPVENGGSDKGPSPHELFLASLGSCTAITVRMYANRKGWDLQSVDVSLNMEKIADGGKQKTSIIQQIKLNGNLSVDERKRLMDIADKCPVHKTLESTIEIISKEKN